MFNYVWPIALVLLSNTIYQIAAKGIPGEMNSFASLTITYAVAAIFCLIMFFITNKDSALLMEYAKTNWAPFALGVVIVGLEVGFVFAYRAGWPVSEASVVANTLVAIALIFVAALLYKEQITMTKAAGIALCIGGLVLINK